MDTATEGNQPDPISRTLCLGVSVVIPAYNYARYLPDAVHSALAQNWATLEVIVVDDGSTDETPIVLAVIRDHRLRVIRQENAGLSSARNTGIREAKHELIAFLDADDRWGVDFLSTVAGEFSKLPADFALVASGSQRMTQDGQLVEQPRRVVPPPRILTAREFILRNRVFPSAVVARKSAFDRCGYFDTALRSSEDRDMWIRITTHFRAAYIDKPLVHIRRHGENMSKHAVRMRANTAKTLGKAWQSAVVSRMNLYFWARTRSVFEYTSAWTHFSAGLRGPAFRYLAFSFLLCPFFVRPSELNESPLFRLRALRHFLFSSAATPKLTPIGAAK